MSIPVCSEKPRTNQSGVFSTYLNQSCGKFIRPHISCLHTSIYVSESCSTQKIHLWVRESKVLALPVANLALIFVTIYFTLSTCSNRTLSIWSDISLEHYCVWPQKGRCADACFFQKEPTKSGRH